ncbi:hypothetical protein BJ322DRAFT_293719 [Thelephora terrestris]|uniref:Uncharacterized protein n=1 Tax=Thelephora terrestris TaxID=56493 RepID=A0A9P6H728_9AGAM|nr:hypothetical protein BJ322DRAFT_293719 [Thelephora terrestris]
MKKLKVILEKFKGGFEKLAFVLKDSEFITIVTSLSEECGSCSIYAFTRFLKSLLLAPLALALDFFLLGWAVARRLVTLSTGTYHLVRSAVGDFATVLARLRQLRSTRATKNIDRQASISDLRCISWTLLTSLDKDIRLSAVEYLTAKTELAYFEPTLVADPCLDVLIGCVSISGRKVAIMQDKEELATASAKCFLRSIYHLLEMDPHPSVLTDIY